MRETYNGWANYDTWLVVVWLENDVHNYEKISSMDQDTIESLDINDIENMFYYGDRIDFDNVDLDEIIDMMLDLV